jgi:hypothetical protein
VEKTQLTFRSGHLIASLMSGDWLLDTGSPISFGSEPTIYLDGNRFSIIEDYFGLNSAELSKLVGEPLVGLLGMDIISQLDLMIDIESEILIISHQPIDLDGMTLDIEEFMSVPIFRIRFAECEHRVFFDTGAQISYFQNDSIGNYEAAGKVQDFFPGMGEFDTDTYQVPFSIGSQEFEFRCGRLPDLLGLTLVMASVEGIIGNEICAGRKLGFFARRQLLVLA